MERAKTEDGPGLGKGKLLGVEIARQRAAVPPIFGRFSATQNRQREILKCR